MTDPWDDAIKEAYASCPVDIIILPTLELRNPSFQDDEGNPTAARIVYDQADLTALLESDALLHANQQVLFQKCAFEFSIPESSDRLPELQLSIDGVTRELSAYLELAVSYRAPIDITYREFLHSNPLSGPHYVLNGLTLRRVTSNIFRVAGSASFFDFANMCFPKEVYTRAKFPGLNR